MLKISVKAQLLLLVLLCHAVLVNAGGLFNVATVGKTQIINTTIPNHTYPYAGIKLITSGYTLAQPGIDCTPRTNGYCLFSVSDRQSASITLAGAEGVSSFILCLDAHGSRALSCQIYSQTSNHTVGGVVTNLTQGSLVLQNNGGGNLSITTNTPFTFSTPVSFGGQYNVTVLTQPVNQFCTVTNGTGRISESNIMNVTVNCVGLIFTFAGNGSLGSSGDGGAAILAQLEAPRGVDFDSSKNFYIADTINNRIRLVTAGSGIISTVVGTGVAGYSGDNGPAIDAELSFPTDITLDASGNEYIADSGNSCIRKVTALTGVITTVAGVCGATFYGGDNGLATAAYLYSPSGLDLDSSGNIYIADTFNNRIRKVTASTGIITTIAGTGTPGYSGDGGLATAAEMYHPFGVAVDTSGNIYIADTRNFRVRKVDALTGIISTIAGTGLPGNSGNGGPATAAMLSFPQDVDVDFGGNVYIAVSGSIRKITVGTNIINDAAGTGVPGYSGDGGPSTQGQVSSPFGLSVDGSNGNIYIADTGNDRIRLAAQ